MRSTGRALRLIPIAALILLLTSCEEPDNMAYVTAMGIDKAENGYLYTIQFAQPTKISGGASEEGGSGENIVEIISVEAPTIYSAINVADTIISKDLSLSHAKVFVVSEEVAAEGLSPLNDVIIRNNDIRADMYIAVAPDAGQYLEDVRPTLELNPVKYYQLTYENKNGSAIPQNTAFDFYSACLSGSKDCLLPLAGVAKTEENAEETQADGTMDNLSQERAKSNESGFENENKNYYAGQTGKKLSNKSEVLGSAVFKGDRYIGRLGSTETELHNILMDHFTVMNISFRSDTEPEHPLTVRIEEKTVPVFDIDMENKHVRIRVELYSELLSAPVSYKTTHSEEMINAELSEMVNDAAEGLLKKTYREMNADILGIRGRAKRKFITNADHDEFLRNFRPEEWSFEVRAELKIKRTGMTYFYE